MNLPENIYSIETSSRFVPENDNPENKVPIGATIFPKVGQAINTDKKKITSVDCYVDRNTAIVEVLKQQFLDPKFFFLSFLRNTIYLRCCI